MPWKNWVSNENGSESRVKVERESDGGSTTHFLNTGGGSRENHTHVVVKEDKDGGKVAHCYPHKEKRK